MKGIFVVYILVNDQNKRYIGITHNLNKRLNEHNKGISTYTRNKGPWSVLWKSIDMSHTEALALERKMKKQKGGKGLFVLMKHYGS